MTDILIIGSGPTALYSVAALLRQPAGLSITIVEREELSGTGMPFRPDATDAILLANIASIEIPPICETFLDWIKSLPADLLAHFGITETELHDRHFFPRVLLGGYLRSQLGKLVDRAEAAGHELRVLNRTEAVDVARLARGFRVTALQSGQMLSLTADAVILATGHVWPEDQPEHGTYASPWPSAKLHALPPEKIGILGSSLSGIDAALSIATQHGRFEDDGRSYRRDPAAAGLKISLLSRKGLLPEADFWCPIPHIPLSICTPDRLEALARQPDLTVAEMFDLVRQEITHNDPDYAAEMGLETLTEDDFAAAYFAPRLGKDQFALAAANLADVERNAQAEHTVPWRYTILRLHEAMAPLVTRLSERERARFADLLAPVFIDNYAAVPPRTIRRLLALAEAGVLEVLAIGDDARIEGTTAPGPTIIRTAEETLSFPYFVDARGQATLKAADLPFPTLLEQLGLPEDAVLPVNERFHVAPDRAEWRGLFCAALPHVMHLFPFAQGLTVSHEFGETLSAEIAALRDADLAAEDAVA